MFIYVINRKVISNKAPKKGELFSRKKKNCEIPAEKSIWPPCIPLSKKSFNQNYYPTNFLRQWYTRGVKYFFHMGISQLFFSAKQFTFFDCFVANYLSIYHIYKCVNLYSHNWQGGQIHIAPTVYAKIPKRNYAGA